MDPYEQADRFPVGCTIDGRYRIERPLGAGAMGLVARAVQLGLGKVVAIKFLRPELRRDPLAVARIQREAKALARLDSEHIPGVFDVGATLLVGPYLVMEYLEGTSLAALLERDGPLSVPHAVDCVLQLCEALKKAHAAGVVHRDVKPENLLLCSHGERQRLKLLDFGICAGVALDDVANGADAVPYGTPSYMSPERVRNERTADHRADIWSVGVVLHELLTGRGLFGEGSVTAICCRIVADDPVALESNEAMLPRGLRAIIARCLQRDPARRYQGIHELAAALGPFARRRRLPVFAPRLALPIRVGSSLRAAASVAIGAVLGVVAWMTPLGLSPSGRRGRRRRLSIGRCLPLHSQRSVRHPDALRPLSRQRFRTR